MLSLPEAKMLELEAPMEITPRGRGGETKLKEPAAGTAGDLASTQSSLYGTLSWALSLPCVGKKALESAPKS